MDFLNTTASVCFIRIKLFCICCTHTQTRHPNKYTHKNIILTLERWLSHGSCSHKICDEILLFWFLSSFIWHWYKNDAHRYTDVRRNIYLLNCNFRNWTLIYYIRKYRYLSDVEDLPGNIFREMQHIPTVT